MNLIDTVRNNLTEHDMIRTNDTVICAVSGGADSICMLCALHEIGGAKKAPGPFKRICVHVHHGIRGKDADEDVAFVRAFCDAHRIPFLLKAVDAPDTAGRTPHASLEEAARHLRYRALKEAANECAAPGNSVKIAVAHNLDDNAETVLLNLFRGTGMRGLSGIRPVSGSLIRPLYNIPRTAIEAYLEQNHLEFRTDKTNGDKTYARNRIRNELLISAKEHINAQSARHIAQTAGDMLEADRFVARCTDEAYERCKTALPPYLQDREGVCCVLSVAALRREDSFLRAELISRLLHKVSVSAKQGDFQQNPGVMVPPPSSYYQIGRTHIRAVLSLILSGNGRASLDLPDGIRAVRIHDFLMINVV